MRFLFVVHKNEEKAEQNSVLFHRLTLKERGLRPNGYFPLMRQPHARIETTGFVTHLSQKRKLPEATHICRLFHMISCAYTGRVGKANIQWKEVGEIYGKQL